MERKIGSGLEVLDKEPEDVEKSEYARLGRKGPMAPDKPRPQIRG